MTVRTDLENHIVNVPQCSELVVTGCIVLVESVLEGRERSGTVSFDDRSFLRWKGGRGTKTDLDIVQADGLSDHLVVVWVLSLVGKGEEQLGDLLAAVERRP